MITKYLATNNLPLKLLKPTVLKCSCLIPIQMINHKSKTPNNISTRKITPPLNIRLLTLGLVMCIGGCLLLSFSGCEKAETPVEPYDRGEAITDSVNLGHLYRNQIWYDLHTNSVVSSNLKTDWDLAFSAANDGFEIKLNGSRAMFAYPTNANNLASISMANLPQPDDPNWKCDDSSGDLSKTAIGDWQTDNPVYIIDRGYNLEGDKMGYLKVLFSEIANGEYVFSYAGINSTDIQTATIAKDDIYNFVYFSFDAQSSVIIAPPKDSYDLVFTQYTHVFEEAVPSLPFFSPPFPYVVTGVLQNPNGVMVAVNNDEEYKKISLQDIYNYSFEENLSTIGWEWKVYDFDANAYLINPSLSYLIEDVEGYFYKLRFIDFYNNEGEKGHPTFEFQKL